MVSGTYSPKGNTKLGKSIGVVNRQAGTTCPGASAWCEEHCYAKKGNFQRFGLQKKYGQATLALPAKLPKVVRIHVSGDFDSVDYIRFWSYRAIENRDTLFYAYTRSWNVPELYDALEALRDQPNVQLFASTDSTMPEPPPGWRVAYIQGDTRFRGMTCLEQVGKMPDCGECGYCFRKTAGNVEFLAH